MPNNSREDALRLHSFYRGKIEVVPKCAIKSYDDFAIWYTPYVAEPSREIFKNKEKVFEYTNRGNCVAIVSDGTRVLGLGDIGPEAGLPVMEGKALLFKYLGGVDAVPLCLDTKDAEKIIDTVLLLQPSFGGVNLEDIEQPKCFRILDELRKRAQIPVWHDDQQGTATVVLAGLINALKLVGKKLSEVKIALIGAGAANVKTAHILIKAGAEPENIVLCDSKGILNRDRVDLYEKHKEKWELCEITNGENIKGGIQDALRGADVCIAASKPGPDTIKPEWVKNMASDAIVFACANPVPEILPGVAKMQGGARIVATGRSDFPNQINNSLGFPGIFRGVLDVMAKTITDEMCIAAAESLAQYAEKKGITEEYILPRMDDWEVFIEEAVAVGMKAMEQGVAALKISKEELLRKAEEKICRAREETHLLMKNNIIPEYK
jgi:malate dehydrogenase (oxaloacetate-decarboxylating)